MSRFLQNILGLKDIPQSFVLQVYYTFHKIPEARWAAMCFSNLFTKHREQMTDLTYMFLFLRVGDVVLGLCCLFVLVTLKMMMTSLGSAEDEAPRLNRTARGLVWSLATSESGKIPSVFTWLWIYSLIDRYFVHAVRNALVVIAATAVAYSAEVTGSHFFSLTGKSAKGLPPFEAPPLSEIANGTVITFRDIANVSSNVVQN